MLRWLTCVRVDLGLLEERAWVSNAVLLAERHEVVATHACGEVRVQIGRRRPGNTTARTERHGMDPPGVGRIAQLERRESVARRAWLERRVLRDRLVRDVERRERQRRCCPCLVVDPELELGTFGVGEREPPVFEAVSSSRMLHAELPRECLVNDRSTVPRVVLEHQLDGAGGGWAAHGHPVDAGHVEREPHEAMVRESPAPSLGSWLLLDRRDMQLQVLLGRERGRIYTVEAGTHIVGRGADATVVLDSTLVSRHHAGLVIGPGDIRITDLESSNGTFINGARVVGEGVAVPGDTLLIGDFPMRVYRTPAPALSPRNAADAIEGRPARLPIGDTTLLEGGLLEVPPAVLLRYCAVLKKTGILELTSPPLRSSIGFVRGHISEVVVDTRRTRDPIQALTAILRWKGTFQLAPPRGNDASLLLGLDAVLPPVGTLARPSMLPPRR